MSSVPSIIPSNRPVKGKDLDAVCQKFGLSVNDACWLYGLSITKWTQIVRKGADEPVKDPTLALLVRFLADTKQSIIPKFPNAAEMYELFSEITEIDQKRFSVMFGSEASATYRWLKPNAKVTPAVGRLMYYIKLALLGVSPDKRPQIVDNWRETVIIEARARGVDDIFKVGSWTPKLEEEAAE